jgi:hypothetical protein
MLTIMGRTNHSRDLIRRIAVRELRPIHRLLEEQKGTSERA